MASKLSSERNQRTLLELVVKPGNDICADCKARSPRWASHNIGIFICVRCASIHRKIGTHITKVKSLTMDSWSKEQVEVMKQYGNIVSNSYYNPDETRHPPPVNSAEAERDSELERFIRDKYEFKRFIPDKSAVAARLLGPSQSAASRSAAQPKRAMTTSPSVPAITTSNSSQASGITPSPSAPPIVHPPARSSTQPFPSSAPAASQPRPVSMLGQPQQQAMLAQQGGQQMFTQNVQQPATASGASANPLWNDLVSLQTPSVSSSLPLQFAQPSTMAGLSAGAGFAPGTSPGSFTGLSASNTGFAAGTSPGSLGGMAFGGGSAPMVMSPSMNTGMSGSNPFQQQQQLFASTPSLGGMSTTGGQFTGLGNTNPFQQQQQQQAMFTGAPNAMQAQPTGNPFAPMMMQPSLSSQGLFQPQTTPQGQPFLQASNQFINRSPSPGVSIGGGGVGAGQGAFGPGAAGNPFAAMGNASVMSPGMGMAPQGMMQGQQPFGQQQQQQLQQQSFGQQPFGQQQPQMFGGMGGVTSNNPFGQLQGWQSNPGGQQNWGGM